MNRPGPEVQTQGMELASSLLGARPTEAQTTRVLRSNGRIEGGWKVAQVQPDGIVHVYRADPGEGNLEKDITASEFYLLNRKLAKK